MLDQCHGHTRGDAGFMSWARTRGDAGSMSHEVMLDQCHGRTVFHLRRKLSSCTYICLEDGFLIKYIIRNCVYLNHFLTPAALGTSQSVLITGVAHFRGGFVLLCWINVYHFRGGPLGQSGQNTLTHFRGWICTIKHTLGLFRVARIQGWPHFRGGFVL